MNVQVINQTYKTLESLGIQVYLMCIPIKQISFDRSIFSMRECVILYQPYIRHSDSRL